MTQRDGHKEMDTPDGQRWRWTPQMDSGTYGQRGAERERGVAK